ncbi:M24 family metallopeptidase [Aerococcus sanguinicola]|uniref:M24 family metallopeptidase n=1 Tax=unclassified Aerococcus TaxID=2618060 RepID=UPI0008A59825|nr:MULTISPECIES: Xaa-Pro peptidase family protein [unclassified Aerococcus]KAB0647919.1 aminopeptidase P family protein [Aerococcus sanguinicola]MDK6233414.1 Xaa-Pro peptidase family protein [Aerococcus sp. UMB10185]MDK6855603.1 Xaa-Pro peptidase family protein [Aerococcus sp. UMB7533]OFN02246.1 Xaa-Pro aminopeptidase [Aerococcus sp. HMSC062A02]OHO43203.1 Xaa-Pro aminopeptidase [Aerococcus sp. HMSC035B07]
MASEYRARLRSLQDRLESQHVTQILVTDPYSIYYYTGVLVDPMERLWLLIVPYKGRPCLVANELFRFQVDDIFQVLRTKDQDDFGQLVKRLPLEEVGNFGIDKQMTANYLLPLITTYPLSNFSLASHLVDQQRGVKSAGEQELMRQASALNDQAMARLVEEVLPYGPSEIEACQALEKIYREVGADGGFSFEPIVAYGANGADPHHLSDHSRPQVGDAIVVDIGCRHQGYCSDMTRTFYYGQVSDKDRALYQLTLEAQEAGIAAVKVGQATFQAIDSACRTTIAQASYGDCFIHRTGHFIGQETHEAGDVSQANTQVVQAGQCFSIEPGIYLEDETAVRIEDLVIAQADGVEIINHYPKELTVIPVKGERERG